MLSFLLPNSWAEQACQPFRVYRSAELPAGPPIADFRGHTVTWEKDLVHQISHYEKNSNFEDIYWKTRSSSLSERSRFAWLKCILHYVSQDADSDGQQDWTAIVDQKITRTLVPVDRDLDGDGVDNILDSHVMHKSKASKVTIPPHLLASNRAARVWQRRLQNDYGIMAIDHTAAHSPYVLKEFYELLKKSFSNQFVRSLSGVHVLYAFASHDDRFDLAAYHQQMRAISVAGDEVYLEELDGPHRDALFSTLAHELGHAFLLEKIHPSDLRAICEKNGWKDVFRSDGTDSFYSEAFFRRHPGWPSAVEARRHNFFTAYSYSNAHEWFANAFAEVLIASVNQKNFEGSPAFSEWLKPQLQ